MSSFTDFGGSSGSIERFPDPAVTVPSDRAAEDARLDGAAVLEAPILDDATVVTSPSLADAVAAVVAVSEPAAIAVSEAVVEASAPLARRVRRQTRRLLAALDVAGIVLGIAVGMGLLAAGLGVGTVEPRAHLGAWTLAYAPVYLLACVLYGLDRRERRRLFATNFPDLMHLAHALLAGGGATLGISHLLRHYFGVTPTVSLTGAVFISVPMLITVPVVRVLGGLVVRRRGLVRSRIIILGSGTVADSVARRLAAFADLELLGCVDDPGPYADGGRGVTSIGLLGQVSELPRLCAELDADRVIVAFSPTETRALADTLRRLPSGVQISVVPRLFDLLTWRSHVDELHGLPVMDVAPPALSPGNRAVKRAFDVVVSGAVIVVTLPAWVMIAIAIRSTSAGPVFFRQKRAGRGGQPFDIFKFRTMRQGADTEKALMQAANEVDGPLFKIREDPRVTPVGQFLRATSLDELPQLFNVLKGDMSLVGPRPFVIDEAGKIDGWAARRFDMRPGMTGLWQVSGRNDLPFEDLQRLDYAYVASWSPGWDLKIVWQTPGTVIRRRGAY
jgi:exopolysaccharide biosynthesis polyprenyl glycosylphosphotransferase